LLVDAPEKWTEWQIDHAAGTGRPAEFLDDSRARLICEPSGWMDIDRAARSSTIHLPEVPALEEIVQPRLGITAVVAAYWGGNHRFHAGAFIANGLAWGVLGTKGDGKSSLLAALASSGVPVLADDVLIVDQRLNALAGPRCIDLRRGAARALGIGSSIGVVGTRERWRTRLPQVPREVPIGGFVCLEWGKAAVSQVSPEDRVSMLLASQALLIGEQHRDSAMLASLMELITLPMLRMRRPRAINRIAATGQTLLEALGQLDRRDDSYRSDAASTAQ
jgi:hypothetical protein